MKRIDIVCYTSKLCNLRCRYCYELPMLSDESRMSIEQIERMFVNVAQGYRAYNEPIGINFYWHGGEPLLIPPSFYDRVFEIQRRIFSQSTYRVTNSIQSNFTVMDDDRIALLRTFDAVGISLDLFTGLRVNTGGIDLEHRALQNLDLVQKAGIEVAGITVISKSSLARIPDIYQFYRDRRMAFRVLPLEKGLYSTGQDFELGPHEVLRSFRTLIDLWLEDENPVNVMPLDRYLRIVVYALQNPTKRLRRYDPREWPSVLLVDTNGSVYTYAERFERILGNLFTASVDQILAGHEFEQAASATLARMKPTCERCPHYERECLGDPIGDSGQEFMELEEDGSLRCVVARGIIEHLQLRLREKGYSNNNGANHETTVRNRSDFALS